MTVALNVYAQVAMKIAANSMDQAARNGTLIGAGKKVLFLVSNGWVLSSFSAAFLAAIVWMFAVAKLPLSHAYPFLAMTFVCVMFLGNWLFLEAVTWPKVVGVSLIVAGIVVSAQSFEAS